MRIRAFQSECEALSRGVLLESDAKMRGIVKSTMNAVIAKFAKVRLNAVLVAKGRSDTSLFQAGL